MTLIKNSNYTKNNKINFFKSRCTENIALNALREYEIITYIRIIIHQYIMYIFIR